MKFLKRTRNFWEIMRNSEGFVFNRTQLVILIWPILVEQFLSVFMGFADTFMVSGVGEAAVSGVSLVDSVNVLTITVLAALSTGGGVVASQYLGRKDEENARHSAAQLYLVLTVSTVVVMAVALMCSDTILQLVFGRIDPQVMSFANRYFCVTVISYPFMGIYNAGAALFRAQGNSKIGMQASLVMNLVNIFGNAWLIYGMNMGVFGAALATLLGRIVASAYVFVQFQKSDSLLRIGGWTELKPNAGQIKRILNIGIPSGLENGMFQIGKLCISSLVSTLGTAAIAANAVAGSVSTLVNIPGNAMSLAVIPIIGRCLGAGNQQQARHYSKLLMYIALAGLLFTNVIFFLFIPEIASWFSLSDEALAMCVEVFRWLNIFSIFFWGTGFVLPNILRSGGDAKFTMTVSMLSMWICRVLLSYFLVKELQMGLLGAWIGMFVDWIARSVCFVKRFFGEKWMEHQVI